MSYEKQTWAYGDEISAEKLNHMEDGIYDASQSGGGTAYEGYDLVILDTNPDESDEQSVQINARILKGGFQVLADCYEATTDDFVPLEIPRVLYAEASTGMGGVETGKITVYLVNTITAWTGYAVSSVDNIEYFELQLNNYQSRRLYPNDTIKKAD